MSSPQVSSQVPPGASKLNLTQIPAPVKPSDPTTAPASASAKPTDPAPAPAKPIDLTPVPGNNAQASDPSAQSASLPLTPAASQIPQVGAKSIAPSTMPASRNSSGLSSATAPHAQASSANKSPSPPREALGANESSQPSESSFLGPILGAVFAIMVLLVMGLCGVLFIRRRRRRARNLWEAQRMRNNNFEHHERELAHEKQMSIEAILEADLARLRNLGLQVDTVNASHQDMTRGPSIDMQSTPYGPPKIPRKPSIRAEYQNFQVTTISADVHSMTPPPKASQPVLYQAEELIDSPSKKNDVNTSPASTSSALSEVSARSERIGKTPAHYTFGPDMNFNMLRPEPTQTSRLGASSQAQIESTSFDKNNWPQSPSVNSGSLGISPIVQATHDSTKYPSLAPLPQPALHNSMAFSRSLELAIMEVNKGANKTLT